MLGARSLVGEDADPLLRTWQTLPISVVPLPPPSLPVAEATAIPTATPTVAVIQVDAPSILDVACDGSRTTVAATAVRAQIDGVHIRFTNTSGQDLPYEIENVSGASVPPAGASIVDTLAPGTYRLTCSVDLVRFEVRDPAALYKAAACAGSASATGGTSDFVQGATGIQGTPEDVARRQLHGLKAGDVVERAGYPQAKGDQSVRIVRRGEVLAILTYADDGAGGWLLGGTRLCAGSGLTVVTTGH